jgi:CheY-like chemotaxis protein
MLTENPEGNLNEKQIEFASTIHTAGNDLLALISDILDLSKVEAGKMELRRAPVTLQRAREQVEQAFRPVAAQKGLGFQVLISPGAPKSIVTDEQRLQQVLRNLVSNAFKFTDSGEVVLRVEATEQASPGGDPYALMLSVSDTGIGIPDDKLRLIFEAFQQADGTTNRRYGGTGLGLSISREIARMLGGEIQVRSTPGEGSTFTLLLPAEAPPASASPPASPAGEIVGPPSSPAELATETENGGAVATVAPVLAPGTQAEGDAEGEAEEGAPLSPAVSAEAVREASATDSLLAGRKILVVDDDMRNLFALTSALELHGMSVLFAENGRSALAQLREHPDTELVLMDIMMPEMDGYEAIREIRRQPRFERLPIIALTAKAMRGDREKSVAAGASAHVAKPVDITQLIAQLRSWILR